MSQPRVKHDKHKRLSAVYLYAQQLYSFNCLLRGWPAHLQQVSQKIIIKSSYSFAYLRIRKVTRRSPGAGMPYAVRRERQGPAPVLVIPGQGR